MPAKKALQLRHNMTDAERKLWAAVRNRQLNGIKFRRQHPLGRYVLDFFSEAHKLAIELDGGPHAENVARDAVRTAWLKSHGCRVLRFWNNEALSNLPGVLAEISRAVGGAPHPLAAARDLSRRER